MTDKEKARPDAEFWTAAFATPGGKDVQKLALAKEISLLAYAEQRKLIDVYEGRAFSLMQFAKVGLTIIAGIAGLISNASIHDTPFRESLILLLATAAAFLGKLFWRATRAIEVSNHSNAPETRGHPSEEDIHEALSDKPYAESLQDYLRKINHFRANVEARNIKRANYVYRCYANTWGFLVAFFLFFALSLLHLVDPTATLWLPYHRIIGGTIFVIALVIDNISSQEKTPHEVR